MDRIDFYIGVVSFAMSAVFVGLALRIRHEAVAPRPAVQGPPRQLLPTGFALAPVLLVQAAGFATAGVGCLIDYAAGPQLMATVIGAIAMLLLVAPVPAGWVMARRSSQRA